MLYRLKDMVGCAVKAADGDVGHIKDVYFDDHSWSLRYLVVQTGSWLNSQEVLLTPAAVQPGQTADNEFVTKLTMQQVKDSPPLTSDLPVSRQYEDRLHGYYGWTPYWDLPLYSGCGLYSYPAGEGAGYFSSSDEGTVYQEYSAEVLRGSPTDDPHLRSYSEVKGYSIEATDGKIGHIEDMLVDSASWRLSHVVVDTRNWLPGMQVVVDVGLVRRVDWAAELVTVALTREDVKASPPYAAELFLDEAYQQAISAFYQGLARSRANRPQTSPPAAE